MRARRLQCCALILCIVLTGSLAHAGPIKKSGRAETSARQGTRASVGKHNRTPAATKKWRKRGQQGMNAKRVREIQAALIRANYLKGHPNGVWDQRSQQAMASFQRDNRWQHKVVPDSRALIKLGLGPDRSNLLNPETADISFAQSGSMPVAALARSPERR